MNNKTAARRAAWCPALSNADADELALARRERREFLYLKERLAAVGIGIDGGSVCWLSPATEKGERITIDILPEEHWLHILLPAGRSPARSMGCVKLIEPEAQ